MKRDNFPDLYMLLPTAKKGVKELYNLNLVILLLLISLLKFFAENNFERQDGCLCFKDGFDEILINFFSELP